MTVGRPLSLWASAPLAAPAAMMALTVATPILRSRPSDALAFVTPRKEAGRLTLLIEIAPNMINRRVLKDLCAATRWYPVRLHKSQNISAALPQKITGIALEYERDRA